MEDFGVRLKEIRTSAALSQKQLAEILETTDDSVYSWEKGRSQPSIEMLRRICRALEVTADYLIGLEDEYGNKEQPCG